MLNDLYFDKETQAWNNILKRKDYIKDINYLFNFQEG